jgi:hypothetical protein
LSRFLMMISTARMRISLLIHDDCIAFWRAKHQAARCAA